jgi:signal transduction histidine kinase
MKISLKARLFGAFFGLIVFSVSLTLLLNSTLLEKYYYDKKEDIMLQSFQIIKEAYKNDAGNIMLDIEKIESLRGIRILFFDKDFKLIYNSRQGSEEARNLQRFEPKEPFFAGNVKESFFEGNLSEKFSTLQKDKPLIEMRFDRRMEANFVSLYGKVSDAVYVYLGTPVAAIQESADIAVKFSIITGLLTIILGGIIIYLLTSRITKPILKLNDIAKKMTFLDFSEKYDSGRRDEIGTLGDSINSLSTQLEKSIGELQQANTKLMQDIEKERKIDEMRKGFISNVSHELKTPIALVQGYAEGLKLNINDDEENKNYYCEVIIDEAEKMNSMVKKLLELSELEFNNISLDREDFGAAELIKNVLKKNSIILTEKSVNVTFNSNGNEELIINADYYLTEQVLLNYISNAINHLDNKKLLTIDLKIVNNKARVEVFNSGSNIPDDSIENIWMSFYKVDKARTRAYGGTGLGLSIVKATQKAHNNGYGVENRTGGVAFWFEADIAI